MDSLNPKRSLVEEDANISLFRRRNKIIILVFLFLIISSALIIAALITEVVRIHNNNTAHSHDQALISPIGSFCSVSDSPTACLNAFIPLTKNRLILDPDQILTISLQTSVFQIHQIINSSLIASDSACSHSLRHALSQLGRPLASMRVDPFVSDERREEIGKRIVAAVEDVKSCVDQLVAGDAAAEKLAEVEEYLNGGRDFVFRRGVVRNWGTNFVVSASYQTSLIYDYLFEVVMCGMQVVFMFGMFCALFRIR